jgi:PAS domain S-box-containing protein
MEVPRLLLVADPPFGRRIQEEIQRARIEATYERVETPGRFVAALDQGRWHLVAHQRELPQLGWDVAQALLSDRGLDTPLIVVGGDGDAAREMGEHTSVHFCRLACLPLAARLACRQIGLQRALERAERRLREREELYTDLLDGVRDIVYVHDRKGVITYVNGVTEELGGYRPDEIIGRNFAEFIAPEYLEVARRGADEDALDAPQTYEVDFLPKHGGRVRLEISSRLILRDGRAHEVHGTARRLR